MCQPLRPAIRGSVGACLPLGVRCLWTELRQSQVRQEPSSFCPSPVRGKPNHNNPDSSLTMPLRPSKLHKRQSAEPKVPFSKAARSASNSRRSSVCSLFFLSSSRFDADHPAGAVIIFKPSGEAMTEREAREALGPFGALDFVCPTSILRGRSGNLPDGIYARFAFYLDCRDALKVCYWPRRQLLLMLISLPGLLWQPVPIPHPNRYRC